MGRLDPRNRYVPVRLGDVNTQTRWVLERSGAREPEFLPHVMLRVQDVMREDFPHAPDVRAGARGRPADVAPRHGPRADRGRRRRARGRADRARAGAALHPRVARAVRARRAGHRGRDRPRGGGRRWSAASEAAEVSGQIWCMAMDIGVAAERDRARRRRGRRQPRRRAARRDRARRRPAGRHERDHAHRRHARAGEGSRRSGRHLAAGQLRDRAHGHAVRAVPVADRPGPADRAAGRPAVRRRRRGQGGPLPGGGRGRLRSASRSGWSRAPTCCRRARAGCCWSTTPSRRRA